MGAWCPVRSRSSWRRISQHLKTQSTKTLGSPCPACQLFAAHGGSLWTQAAASSLPGSAQRTYCPAFGKRVSTLARNASFSFAELFRKALLSLLYGHILQMHMHLCCVSLFTVKQSLFGNNDPLALTSWFLDMALSILTHPPLFLACSLPSCP